MNKSHAAAYLLCACAQFLIPKNEPGSVPAVLQRMMAFEPIGALAVNWCTCFALHFLRPAFPLMLQHPAVAEALIC
jgi:hypothetical protein